MATLEELRARVADIEAEQRKLNDEIGDQVPTDEQDQQWDDLVARHNSAAADLETAEKRASERRSVVANLPTRGARTEPGDGARQAPNVNIRRDGFALLESRGHGMSNGEFRREAVDAILRANEHRIDDADNQAHFERALRRFSGDRNWALNLLGRSHEDYESAFFKLMVGRAEMLTAEERTAAQVGSNPLGGYLVPTHLDPTIILTNSGSTNAMRQISRVVELTEGNVWNGVTSAGVTASFDAELTEVSDDTPTFGRPTVTLNTAKSLVQATLETFRDTNLASDVLMLFADARDRLEGSKFMTGSGTNEPRGIFTALDANTNVEITSTTAATIGVVDLHSVYRQVPIRWRNRSRWLMNPLHSLAIKALGTAVSASYSGDLTQSPADFILGRPVTESDDAPSTQITTTLDQVLALGDFSNYVIVDKPGSMAVEFIPHLFSTTTNLPDGRRGWYAWWSTGGNSVNDVAFRLLLDKTSA